MRIVRAEGAGEVAALLRALADQVEEKNAPVGAAVEFPSEGACSEEGDLTEGILEVRLVHPKAQASALPHLEWALSRPGD